MMTDGLRWGAAPSPSAPRAHLQKQKLFPQTIPAPSGSRSAMGGTCGNTTRLVRRAAQATSVQQREPSGRQASRADAREPGVRTDNGDGFSSTAIARDVVVRFFSNLNARDLGSLFSLLAPDVAYSNPALGVYRTGKQAVSRFYIDTLSAVPQGACLVLEEVVVAASPEPLGLLSPPPTTSVSPHDRRVSVAWHLDIGGLVVPGSEGVGLYRVDTQRGVLTELRDTPQPVLNVLLPALSLATPVIDAVLGGAVGVALGPAMSAAPVPPPPVPSASRSPSPPATARAVSMRGLVTRDTTDVEEDAVDGGDGPVEAASFVDVPAPPPPPMDGVWEKDAAASDAASYERMMDVLGLSGLQRVTARLIEGLEVTDNASSGEFAVSFLTVVPFFKVTERVYVGGAATRLGRRDLQPGGQTATAERMGNGGVRVTFKWDQPRAGTLIEEYETAVSEGRDILRVTSRIAVPGHGEATTTQVYVRSGQDRAGLLAASRARNTSLSSVLARQRAQFGQE